MITTPPPVRPTASATATPPQAPGPARARFARLAALVLTGSLAFGATDAPAASANEPQGRAIYSGRLEDSQGRPIGGVFPLTFSFFRTEKGGRAVWTESHFVAVDNGVYAIELGRLKPFPKGLDLTRAWLAVGVTGGKEILRDRFVGDVVTTPVPPPTPTLPPANPAVGAPPQPAKGTYADLAGFAYEAEKAKSSDSIGGMTATDIRNLAKQAQAAAAPPPKPKVGAPSRFTDNVGGTGGTEFTLQCPPGHVATGIRGRAAALIDQLSVICSPLE